MLTLAELVNTPSGELLLGDNVERVRLVSWVTALKTVFLVVAPIEVYQPPTALTLLAAGRSP